MIESNAAHVLRQLGCNTSLRESDDVTRWTVQSFGLRSSASRFVESGRLGKTFLRVIFERRPCRYKAGEAMTSVLLQLDAVLVVA